MIMIRKIFLFFFLLTLPVPLYAQPSVVFEEEDYDFGRIESGQAVEHSFEFINAGNEDLLIEKIVSS